MQNRKRSPLLLYGAAFVSSLLALAVSLLLRPLIEPNFLAVFLGAVMFSAWYGGLGPGLVSTALSVFLIDYFFTASNYALVLDRGDIVRTILFIAVSTLISGLNVARKRAEEGLQAANTELESRVEKRTAELLEANTLLETEIFERERIEEALRESEEIHRITLACISDAVFVTDQGGAFTYVCPNANVIFGYSQEEVSALGNIARILGSALCDFDDLESLGEISNIEHEIMDRTGRKHIVLVNIKKVSIKGGTVLYTCRDITDRKQLEEQRIELEREHAANQAKDECLATVSHELRTPLNAILGWVRILQQGHLEKEKSVRGLEVIERSAESQGKLISDLLDVSRIVAGTLSIDARQVEVTPVIESAIEIMRPAASAKSITIEARLDSAVGAIMADPNRLRQVVWNLLANAIKFTPEGGLVEVIFERTNSAANLIVRDTGCGISAEALPSVFERFYQAKETGKRGGLGLGLAIVRHMVELHGGRIRAASAGAGQGTTFTVELPLTTGESASGGVDNNDINKFYHMPS
jgi:PAS domain S-box-containing protein